MSRTMSSGGPVDAGIAELIDSTVTIGTIPRTLAEIQQVADDPGASAADVVEIIERDPAVASKLLRLANNSFYALRNPITTIHHACVILGLGVITRLVVQATVVGRFANGPKVDGFDPSSLWNHSFKTALAARRLSELGGAESGLDRDEAYTCGLLHDVGKMVLMQGRPEGFRKALGVSMKSGMPLTDAIAEVFGFNDRQVCAHLARSWRLGEGVEVSVMRVAPGDGVPRHWIDRGRILECANTLAHRTASAGWLGHVASEDALQSLGVDQEQLDRIGAEIREVAAC